MEERKKIIEDLVSVSQKTAKWMRKTKKTDFLTLENTMEFKKNRKKYRIIAKITEDFNKILPDEEKTDLHLAIYTPPFKDFVFWIYRNKLENEVFQRSVYDQYLRSRGLYN